LEPGGRDVITVFFVRRVKKLSCALYGYAS